MDRLKDPLNRKPDQPDRSGQRNPSNKSFGGAGAATSEDSRRRIEVSASGDWKTKVGGSVFYENPISKPTDLEALGGKVFSPREMPRPVSPYDEPWDSKTVEEKFMEDCEIEAIYRQAIKDPAVNPAVNSAVNSAEEQTDIPTPDNTKYVELNPQAGIEETKADPAEGETEIPLADNNGCVPLDSAPEEETEQTEEEERINDKYVQLDSEEEVTDNNEAAIPDSLESEPEPGWLSRELPKDEGMLA